jgi:hypothetical protein
LVESGACALEIVGIATSEQIKPATNHREFDMRSSPVRNVAHAVPAHERGWSAFRNDP